ncbi:MAG: hypothetical protein K0R84_490 [Clostridia bacterium]|nr:hypothetical protein [Clostridia bacterium]
MKRTFKSFLLATALLLFITQSFNWTFAESRAEDPKINVSVEVGFDGYYKLGYYAPFYFEIENNMKDINGEIQIELPDELDNITLYSMQVNLPQNSTKKFVMNVPITRYSSKLQVNIAEGNTKLFTKAVRVSPGVNIETLGIGILSDDYESVKYINKIPVGNSPQFSTKTIKLTEDMLSDNMDILKNFNAIVINNYDTSKISKEKYEALKAWVVDGGMLLVGTGPSQNKTLAMFKDDFITGEIGEVSTITTDELYSIAQGSSSGENMQISVLNMTLKDAVPIVQEGETPLIVSIKRGSGSVSVAAFDFGLEPLAGWVGRSSFSEKLMQRLLPNIYSNPYFDKGMYMMNNMYAIDNSLRNIPELPKTNTRNLLIVLAAYILVVAPISYFVLKKLDKREWMWVTVPAISLVFALVIYITGFGTRLNEPIINAINIVDFGSNGNAVPLSYAGVFTPNKSNIRIEAADDMRIKPITLNNYGYYGPMPQQDSKKPKQVVTKVTVSPKTVIEYYRTSIWSMRTLVLNNNQNIPGKFDVNINHSKGAYSGTVKNNSGFDMYECYIVTSNQVIEIGAIKNNETITLTDKKGKYYSYSYDMINAIYKDPYAGRKPGQKLTQQEIDEFRQSMQKRQIMEYYLMSQGNAVTGAKLFGWSNTPISKDILVNGKTTKKYEKSFVAADTAISFKTGNRISYPMGYLQPNVMNGMNNGNYDAYGKTFYGRGNVEIQFQIDKNIVPDYVKLQYTIHQGGQSSAKQFIWNVEKNAWEEGSYSAFYMDKERIAKYVDKDNVLKMKFELYDGNLQLPQIAVEGSVK